MKKALFVTGSLQRGGTELHLLALLPLLAERGFQVRLFVFDKYGPLSRAFAERGIDCIGIEMPSKGWPGSRLGRLVRIVRTICKLLSVLWTYRPDIVHFFLPHAYVLGGLTSLLYPNVIRIMSRRSLNCYQGQYPFLSWIERLLHRKMDVIMANSYSIVRELRFEGVSEEDIRLCYNGVIVPPVPKFENADNLRRRLGIPTEGIVFVMVANLIPYKGHADLLEAFAICRNSLPEHWRLLLVGRDDGIGDMLRAKSKALGIAHQTIFTGERKNVSEFLAISDVGISSSHEEGFSNSILEIMYSGIPVIATDVGGNREIIEDGIHGFIVTAADPDQLAKAILKLSGNKELREKMGSAGKKRVVSKFSMLTCADCYEYLYLSQLNIHVNQKAGK